MVILGQVFMKTFLDVLYTWGDNMTVSYNFYINLQCILI